MTETCQATFQIGIRQSSLGRRSRLGRATELVFILATGVTLTLGGQAQAQDITWTDGSGNDAWATPGNWDLDVIPTGTSNVIISGAPITRLTSATTVNSTTISGTGDLQITGAGGALASTNGVTVTGGTLQVGGPGGGSLTGAVVISGGNLAVQGIGRITGDVTVSGTSVANVAGAVVGAVDVQGGRYVANGGSSSVSGVAIVSGGELRNNGGALNGGVVVESGGTFNNNSGTAGAVTSEGAGTNAGTIASLSVTGGTFTNSGAVTGATTVSGGTLNLFAGSNLANSQALTISGGTLNLQANDTVGSVNMSAGSITGTETLTAAGGYTQSGGTIAAGATVTSAAAKSLTGGLVAGTLTGAGLTSVTGLTELTGTISGGELTIGAGGTLAVTGSGALAATGITQIFVLSGGILETDGGALEPGVVVIVNGVGSTVRLTGDETLTGLSMGAGAVLDLNGGSVTITGNPTLSGNATGTGGITASGAAAIVRLEGTNTYAGDTTITNGAEVRVANGAAIADTGTVNVISGRFTLLSSETIGTLTGGSGGAVALGGNTLTVAGAATSSFAGIISGAGELTKSGPGTLTLSGANAHTGVTNVEAGTLTIAHASALGSMAAGTTVLAGATLAVQGGITVAEAITLNGAGVSNSGALRNVSGGNTITGAITLGSDTRINTDAGELVLTGDIIGTNTNLTIAGAGRTTINGIIGTGNGSLTVDKAGAGEQVVALTAANTFTGGTTVRSGFLQLINANSLMDTGALVVHQDGYVQVINAAGETVGALSGSGDIVLQTPGAFVVGDATNTEFSGVISEFGAVGAFTKQGTGTLTLSGANTFTGTTTISAGALQIGNGGTSGALGGGDVVNDGTLIFNRSDNFSYGGIITGSGRLEQVGTGTTNLTGNSGAFTGQTAVSGGTLRVNGTLGGTLSVANAVLGGSGTVGATTIDAGGVIAPGNSIGTLTVDGDLTFKVGSVYQVEVDPSGTTSDLIVVNGMAFLAGSVDIGEDGNLKPFSDYKILTATGGFSGTVFEGANSNYAFLDARLAYGINDVTLRLSRNDVSFASVAGTPNRRAAAGGLDSLSFGNPLYGALVVLGQSGARQAFDQLSGELHGSGIAVLIGNSGKLRSMVSRRFQSVFANRRAATSFPLTSYASSGSSAVQASAGGYSAWGQAFGSWGRTSGDGNAADLRHSDGGFLAGIDAVLAETWSIGVFAGYSRSTFSASDRNSSGSSDNFHLGFHAGTEMGALRLNVGAAHTWHALDTSRTVAFKGFADTLSADYGARTAQVFGEAGYRFGTDALTIEPFAGLAYVHTTTDRFTERGGAAALTAARSTTATTFSTLGLRAFSQFDMGGMQATARGMLGWRHAFGDTRPTTRLNFAGGSGFSVSGTPVAKDTALVEAGLDVAIRENVSFGLSYDGQYSRRTQEHGFNARLRVAF